MNKRELSVEDLDKPACVDIPSDNNQRCKLCKNKFWTVSSNNLRVCHGYNCNEKTINYLCDKCSLDKNKCSICGKIIKKHCRIS